MVRQVLRSRHNLTYLLLIISWIDNEFVESGRYFLCSNGLIDIFVKLSNAEIRKWHSWLRSANATTVQCRPQLRTYLKLFRAGETKFEQMLFRTLFCSKFLQRWPSLVKERAPVMIKFKNIFANSDEKMRPSETKPCFA